METQELLEELRAKILDKSVTREDINKAIAIEPDARMVKVITYLHTFFCRGHHSSETNETESCPYYVEEKLDGTWQHSAHLKWWDLTTKLIETFDHTETPTAFEVMFDYFISAISAIEHCPLELYILVEGYLKAETIEQVMRKFSITYPKKNPIPVAPNQASPSSESYSKK